LCFKRGVQSTTKVGSTTFRLVAAMLCCDCDSHADGTVAEVVVDAAEIVTEKESCGIADIFESGGSELTFLRSGDLGLVLDSWNVGLMVLEVKKESDVNVNAVTTEPSKASGRHIQKFDIITGVDQETSPEGMKSALERSQAMDSSTVSKPRKCTLKVARPLRIDGITIRRNGRPYGLNLVFQEGISCCLQIKAVNDGAVSEYNKTCKPTLQVCQGDFIIAVNGLSGIDASSEEARVENLLNALRLADDVVELMIMRIP